MNDVQHEMGPVLVDQPKRPENWDAYVWQAISHCKRCHEILVAEYWLPGRLMFLIPSDKRDEAIHLMKDFAKARLEFILTYSNNKLPLCKVNK